MTWLLLFLLCVPCQPPRDRWGHIIRNHVAVRYFEQMTGYPHGRPGYVVDHIIPLCACGPDESWNLQWQRADSARMKDRTECRRKE